MPLDTGIRISGGCRIMQLTCKCGAIFQRQARRLKKINYCRPCLKRQMPRFYNWSTAKIKAAIANDNNTDQWLHHYDDMKVVLWEREDRIIN